MSEKTRHTNKGVRKVCDCGRRKWSKCSHPWHFSFKWQGTHHRFTLNKHAEKPIECKGDAETLADRIRTQIRDGKFGQPVAREDITVRQLADTYIDRYVKVERAKTEQAFVWAFDSICRTAVPLPTGGRAALGDWRVSDVVTDTIERVREVRRASGTGVTGVNRNLETLRALFNWALRTGYVDRTPFKRGSEPVVKLSAEQSRSRRLDADTDEETKLLGACAPHLRAILEAALATGMRRGEILSLQWSQIEGLKIEDDSTLTWASRAEIVLPWAKTKTKKDRRIPIASRLRSVLEMRRFDPAGEPLAANRYVFGNEIGQQVQNIKRAWNTAVLKAHGHKPTYTKTANLTLESQAALDDIDLHFHDIRREAGSRWLEGGVPLHTIRDWLGHTSIAQTSTYLAGTMRTQHDAMTQFEAHQSALQRFATKVGKGGQKRPRSAKRPDKETQ